MKYPKYKIFILTEDGIQFSLNAKMKYSYTEIKYTFYDIIAFISNKKSKLDFIKSSKENSFFIWNFTSLSEQDNHNLGEIIVKVLREIKGASLVKNLVLLSNKSLPYEENKRIIQYFDKIYVIDKGRELLVSKEELEKVLWLISGNSENKESEEIIRKSSFMLHELNNQISKLYSSVFKISDKDGNDTLVKMETKTSENSIKESITLLENYKNFIKNMKSQKESNVLSLDEELFQVFLLLKENLHCKINIKTESKANLFCNKAELREIFVNVIKNSYEAVDVETGEINITSLATEDKAYIKIEDNGIGISKYDIAKVFQPFYGSKKIKGTGIGLTISKEIVSRLNGDITINSKLGEGTTIMISLPIYKYGNNEILNCFDKEEKKILVIDSKRAVRERLVGILSNQYGAQVDTSDGRYFEEMTNRVNYDIIISDINLPCISAGEAASFVKGKNEDIYFILMTGNRAGLDINKIKDVDAVITKPVTKEKLEEVLMDYKHRDYIVC